MAALGFSSGLPFLLIGSTLSYRLGEAHVGLAVIGFLSWVGLAYSLKFLWAAIADTVPPPLLAGLGRRRGWLIWVQSGVAVGLLGMAASDPVRRTSALVAFSMLTALCAATQDVVVDALRIEQAHSDTELDLFTSAYQLGYRLANICTASLILLLAGAWGWEEAYGVFAAAMTVGLVATLCAQDRTAVVAVVRRRRGADGVRRALVDPLAAFFHAFGPAAGLILLSVSVYELCDYVRGPVIGPFYVAVGLGKSTVAWTRLAVGLPLSILGTAAGGLFAARYGHMRALIAGAMLQPAAVASFAWLAYAGPSPTIFAALMAFDDFAMSFAGVVLLAYLSTLTSASYTATQFALLTSASVWPGKLLKGFSGVLVQNLAKGAAGPAHAYATFFILGAAICGGGALALVLALAAMRLRPLRLQAQHGGSSLQDGR